MSGLSVARRVKGGRRCYISMRLSDDEKALFERVASERGLSVTGAIRTLMLLADGGRAPLIRLDQLSAADTLIEVREDV